MRYDVQGVENKRCYELNEEEINKIREEVGKYTTEADLVRYNSGGILKCVHSCKPQTLRCKYG